MNRKYTKTEAPWSVAPKGRTVLSSYVVVAHASTVHVSEEEATANAHLIAAAPELLDSCREMIEILNSYAHRIGNGPQVIGRAQAAIQKATH